MADDSMWDFLVMRSKDKTPLTPEQQGQLDQGLREVNASRRIDEWVSRSSGKELFRPIQDFLTEEKTQAGMDRPTPAQIEAWMSEHPGSTLRTSLKLLMGFPEREIQEVPCMAIARYDDHALVLYVDGTTHRFLTGEYEE